MGLAQDELRAVPFPPVEAMPWVRSQQTEELAELARSLGQRCGKVGLKTGFR